MGIRAPRENEGRKMFVETGDDVAEGTVFW